MNKFKESQPGFLHVKHSIRDKQKRKWFALTNGLSELFKRRQGCSCTHEVTPARVWWRWLASSCQRGRFTCFPSMRKSDELSAFTKLKKFDPEMFPDVISLVTWRSKVSSARPTIATSNRTIEWQKQIVIVRLSLWVTSKPRLSQMRIWHQPCSENIESIIIQRVSNVSDEECIGKEDRNLEGIWPARKEERKAVLRGDITGI
jgi:hypothetical protein